MNFRQLALSSCGRHPAAHRAGRYEPRFQIADQPIGQRLSSTASNFTATAKSAGASAASVAVKTSNSFFCPATVHFLALRFPFAISNQTRRFFLVRIVLQDLLLPQSQIRRRSQLQCSRIPPNHFMRSLVAVNAIPVAPMVLHGAKNGRSTTDASPNFGQPSARVALR